MIPVHYFDSKKYAVRKQVSGLHVDPHEERAQACACGYFVKKKGGSGCPKCMYNSTCSRSRSCSRPNI